jgi:DeoR family glycerol-3-phosphate regulon repressor
MSLNERRKKIFELVKNSGYMPIEKLVSNFKVSPQTIRFDLNALADEGRLVRHHGGASIPSSVINTDFDSRRSDFARVKANLGKAVAEAVTDRSSVFISLGTTMISVAKALCVRSGLKIITNNLEAAQILSKQPGFEVIVIGGRLESRNFGTSGSIAMETVANYRPDFCVFSIGGIDHDGQLLDYYENEAAIVRSMIKGSRKRILVVDHSKFGRSASVLVGDFESIDQLFTDKPPPLALRNILKKKKTQLIKISK